MRSTNANAFQRGNTGKKKRSCDFTRKSHAANGEAASPRKIPKMQLALEWNACIGNDNTEGESNQLSTCLCNAPSLLPSLLWIGTLPLSLTRVVLLLITVAGFSCVPLSFSPHLPWFSLIVLLLVTHTRYLHTYLPNRLPSIVVDFFISSASITLFTSRN